MSSRKHFVLDLMDEIEMLRQSNNIEDVWDDLSLQQAIYAWKYMKQRHALTVPGVLQVHKILMLHQPLRPDEKGYFRRRPVFVGSQKAGFREGAKYQDIPTLIRQWIDTVHRSMFAVRRQYNPLTPEEVEENIKANHIMYEHIHPFIDGNGRTGRIFMNWERSQLGLPIHTIHAGEEQYEYYKWFK